MIGKLRCLALALALGVHANAFIPSALAQNLEVKSEGAVTFASMPQLVVHSKVLNGDFLIRISPPLMPPPPGEKPAAVYLLDANAVFGMAADTFRFQTMEGNSWPTYIVSIGYDTTNPAVVMKSRETDFLHAVHTESGKAPIGGGGEGLERFLLEELKPYVESRYGVDPQKSILAGVSYGGLFVANVLTRHPDAFAGYMIGSPSLWADASVVPKANALTGGAGRKVFIGVGEKEVMGGIDMPKDAEALRAALSRADAAFAVSHRVYAGQVHAATPGPWLADGLRYLLTRPGK